MYLVCELRYRINYCFKHAIKGNLLIYMRHVNDLHDHVNDLHDHVNDLHDHVNDLHAPCKWQLNDLHDHVMYYMDYPCKRSFYMQFKETV